MMRRLFLILIVSTLSSVAFSQTQPLNKPESGYRFQHRIKGPQYKKSRILELVVDEYGNYLVATFRGEKSSYIYLIVYNLYTWDEKYKIKFDDNRLELYNSTFDESGDYFYANYDIYRNKFKKINLKTGEIQEVDCVETPKGCVKIEPEICKVEAYTVGDNYYIYRDEKFQNYMRVMVKKEMYIPKEETLESRNSGIKNALFLDPKKGGILQLTPAQIRDLKSGMEILVSSVPVFYDPNAIDKEGNEIPYEPAEGEPYKIRLTDNHIKKLNKKISFVYQQFVVKLDLDAWEEEKKAAESAE